MINKKKKLFLNEIYNLYRFGTIVTISKCEYTRIITYNYYKIYNYYHPLITVHNKYLSDFFRGKQPLISDCRFGEIFDKRIRMK